MKDPTFVESADDLGAGACSTPIVQSRGEGDAAEPEIMTLEEAAKFLRISRPTLLELVKRKQVPGRQIGAQWRFSRSFLLSCLSGNDRVPRSGSKS